MENKIEKIKDSLLLQVCLGLNDFEKFTCRSNGEYNYFSPGDFCIILTPDEFATIQEYRNGGTK